MIQRIQSLYLLVVVISLFLFLFLPLSVFFASYEAVSFRPGAPGAFTDQLAEVSMPWYIYPLYFFLLATLVLSLFTLFQYRNRLFQIRLGKFNMLLHLMIIVLGFLIVDQLRGQMPGYDYSYGAGAVFPLFSLVALFMANRAIKRDEDLVRSADRIR